MKSISLRIPFLLFLLFFQLNMAHAACSNMGKQATRQCALVEASDGFFKKAIKKLKPQATVRKKTDKLAIAVFLGGVVTFLLFFPIKFFWGFVVLGAVTLIAGIIALRRLRKNEDLGGKWLVFLGMAMVIVPAAFIGLVIWALSRL